MAATVPFANPGNAGAAMQQDPQDVKRMLERRLAELEGQINRYNQDDSTPYVAMGVKETVKYPPLEEDSAQPSFVSEVMEHLDRNMAIVASLVEEIHRLRAVIAGERADRRQEQERVLKLLGEIIEHGQSAFPQRAPATNVPPRW